MSGRQHRVSGHLSLIMLHLAPGDTPPARCSSRRHLLSRVFTVVTKATFVTRAQDDGDQKSGTEPSLAMQLSLMSPLVMRITKKNELQIKMNKPPKPNRALQRESPCSPGANHSDRGDSAGMSRWPLQQAWGCPRLTAADQQPVPLSAWESPGPAVGAIGLMLT